MNTELKLTENQLVAEARSRVSSLPVKHMGDGRGDPRAATRCLINPHRAWGNRSPLPAGHLVARYDQGGRPQIGFPVAVVASTSTPGGAHGQHDRTVDFYGYRDKGAACRARYAFERETRRENSAG